MGETSFYTWLRVLTFLDQERFRECIGMGFSTMPQAFSKQSYASQNQQHKLSHSKAVCSENQTNEKKKAKPCLSLRSWVVDFSIANNLINDRYFQKCLFSMKLGTGPYTNSIMVAALVSQFVLAYKEDTGKARAKVKINKNDEKGSDWRSHFWEGMIAVAL